MPRKCSSMICFSKMTCVFILFLIGIIIYILLKKQPRSIIREITSLAYHPRTNCENPHIPPLRDNKFYSQHIGIPINVPTQTVDTNYSATGILTRINGKETILPLFGRPIMFRRDLWQYYAMSDRNNNIKLPISQNGKSCTSEYGCNSLYSGDIVYVEGYNDAFKVTVYENNVPRYIPYI